MMKSSRFIKYTLDTKVEDLSEKVVILSKDIIEKV